MEKIHIFIFSFFVSARFIPFTNSLGKGNIAAVADRIEDYGLNLVGTIPRDSRISELDLEAKPIILIEESCESYKEVEKMIPKILPKNKH